MFFDIRPEKEEIYSLENGKLHNFWHQCFSPKVPKRSLINYVMIQIDKTVIETGLSSNFNDHISRITPFIGKKNILTQWKI